MVKIEPMELLVKMQACIRYQRIHMVHDKGVPLVEDEVLRVVVDDPAVAGDHAPLAVCGKQRRRLMWAGGGLAALAASPPSV